MRTSKEMFMDVLERRDSCAVPVFLRDLTLSLDLIGARTTDVFTECYDHELSARAIAAFRRHTGQDAVVGCIQSAAFNVESFGGTMRYPEYGIPVPAVHPFEDISDIEEIVPGRSGKAEGAVRSYSLVRRMLPDTAVVANVEGPLTKAGTLAGMENLALMTVSEKDLLDKLIRMSVEHTRSFLERIDGEGAMDAVFVAAATDNPDLFGPSVYQEFSIPRVKELADISHRMGHPVIFHPHGVFSGDAAEVFEKTLQTGIDGFQFAEHNDPAVITGRIGGRCAVLGGTDIVPTLLTGTDGRIRSETRRYMDACASGYHVFMPSCSLHRGTDIGRVMTMVDAVRSYAGNG